MRAKRVFISYRRDRAADTARVVSEALRRRRIRVFVDLQEMRPGRFNETMLAEIRACSDFVLILTPGSLDRCLHPDDWVRQEILEALAQGKNIVPVASDDFVWPALPPELAAVKNFQVLQVSRHLFEESMDKLALWLRPQRLLSPLTIGLGLAALVLLAAGGYLLLGRKPAASPPSPPVRPAASIPPASAFAQTIRFYRGEAPNEPAVLEVGAEAILTVDNEPLIAPIAGGEARFASVPSRFLNQTGYLTVSAWDWRVARGSVALPLTGQAGSVLVELAGATLRGTVVGSDDGQPVPQASIELTSLPGLTAKADDSGRFSVYVPRDRLTNALNLEVSAEGYFPTTRVAAPQGPFEIRVTKRPPPRTTFTQKLFFYGPNGTNDLVVLTGATVVMTAGAASYRTNVTEEREAALEGVPLRLVGQSASVSLALGDWRLQSGMNRFVLKDEAVWLGVERPGLTIDGSVHRAEDDQPLAAQVSLAGMSTNTDATGQYRFYVPRQRLGQPLFLVVTAPGYERHDESIPPRSAHIQTIALHKEVSPATTFVQTVRFHGPGGVDDAAGLEDASATLVVGDASFAAVIAQGSEARFEAVPLNLLLAGRAGDLTLNAKGWRLPAGKARVELSKEPVPVGLEPLVLEVKGFVHDAGNQPLQLARISLGGQAGQTDDRGAFFLRLPEASLSWPLSLDVTADGCKPYHKELPNPTGPLDVLLERAAPAVALDTNRLARAASEKNPDVAEGLYRQELDARPQSVKANDDYGMFLRDHNRAEEARPYLSNAVALARKEGDNAGLAAALNDQALVLTRCGQTGEAEKAYEEALRLYKPLAAASPAGRADYAKCLYNRGLMFRQARNFAAARKDLEEAARLGEELVRAGSRDPKLRERKDDYAGTLLSLASTLEAAGERSQAVPVVADAIRQYRDLEHDSADYSPKLAGALEQSAELLRATSDRKGARAAYKEAVEVYGLSKADAPASPYCDELANALNNYAVFLAQPFDPGQAQESLETYGRAIALYQGLTETNPDKYRHYLANCWNNLGTLHVEMDQPARARAAFEHALTSYQQLPDAQRTQYAADEAEVLLNLSHALAAVKDNAAAEERFKDTIRAYNQLLRSGRTTSNLEGIAGAERAYADFLRETTNYVSARKVYGYALDYYTELAGSRTWTNQSDYALALNNSGVNLFNSKEAAAARAAYTAALKVCRDHGYSQLTVQVLKNLAELMKEAGDYNGARDNYNEAVKTCEREPEALRPYQIKMLLGLADLELREAARGDTKAHRKAADSCLARARASLNQLPASEEKTDLAQKERELAAKVAGL